MMVPYNLSFCVLLLVLRGISAEDGPKELVKENDAAEIEDADPDKQIHRPPTQNENVPDTDILLTIETFENIVQHSNLNTLDDIPKEVHENMVNLLKTITHSVYDSHSAFKFLQAKGIDRVIASNIKTTDPELKMNYLILLKVLFDVAPSTTRNVIPAHVVDNLMEIFENDDLDLKSHALDILDAWLPRNPKIQTRVMKLSGLQPFYEQIEDLDTITAKTLLNMFNKILTEHLNVKNEPGLVNEKTKKIYQQIGLIEHISTPTYCRLLLDVFSKFSPYNTKENNIIFTIFELMGTIKPLCLKYLSQNIESKDLFVKLMEFVENPDNEEHFHAHGVNLTEVLIDIEEYMEKIGELDKRPMDEL